MNVVALVLPSAKLVNINFLSCLFQLFLLKVFIIYGIAIAILNHFFFHFPQQI